MVMTDLSDFGVGNVPAPKLRRMRVVHRPNGDGIAGFFTSSNRGQHAKGYATRRGGDHYYQKGEGYAVSQTILSRMEEIGATHVYVFGMDEDDDVYEFIARDFYSGYDVPEYDLQDPVDRQRWVAADSARHVWENHTGDLFKTSIDRALDELYAKDKVYNPEIP